MAEDTQPARVRTIDRHRRERVIAGALTVLADYGVEGLTHRRVAEAAGVPLAATTYYFATREELLGAAMEDAADRDIAALRERFVGVASPADAARAMTSYVLDTAQDRTGTVITAELATAALRRPALRAIAERWDTAWIDCLSPVVGTLAALALSTLTPGLFQRALSGSDATEITAIVDQVLGLSGPTPAAGPD